MVFAVVQTTGKKGEIEVEVVPTIWIDGTRTKWPTNGKTATKLVKNQVDLKKDFTWFECTVLKSDIGNNNNSIYLFTFICKLYVM